MNLPVAAVAVVVAIAVTAAVLAASDQPADAGSIKKVHFTQTMTSVPSPAVGHGGTQMALILPPNNETIYDGSMTFAASGEVQALILHEIESKDDRGQPVWTVDNRTFYGASIFPIGSAGSLEFTGAALGLYSETPDEFAATVTVDGWIRGQPAEVVVEIMTGEAERVMPLARAHVPAVLPMHSGIHEGGELLYIITDSSDAEYAEQISGVQGWNVTHAPPLAELPAERLGDIYMFRNGVAGDGLYGFQGEVFGDVPGGDGYSSLVAVTEVEWKRGQRAVLLESEAAILEAKEGERIMFDRQDVIINAPQIVWPEGQMLVREDPEITDEMAYDGGQITAIDRERMTATFVAHRSWGPDGSTAYHIVTGASPRGPAGTMGVAALDLEGPESSGRMFQFSNGIQGTGPLGFQPAVLSVSAGDRYSPLWKVYLAEWHDPDVAPVLETQPDIDAFADSEQLTVVAAKPTNSVYIVNGPLVDPFQ